MIYILMAFLLSGCGRSPLPITIDPAVSKYFSRFESDLHIPITGVSGVIQPLPNGTVASCFIDSNGTKIVAFDNVTWNYTDDSYHEQLVYHELGHCVMNLGHNPDVRTDTMCPISIMFPLAFGDSDCYKIYKEYYFNQMKVETSKYITKD